MQNPRNVQKLVGILDGFTSSYGWRLVKEYYNGKLLRIYEKGGKYLSVRISDKWPLESLEINNIQILNIISPGTEIVMDVPGWEFYWDAFGLNRILSGSVDNFNNNYNNDRFWEMGKTIYEDIKDKTSDVRPSTESQLDVCPICLVELINEDNECIVVDCCNRSFHRSCLVNWTRSGGGRSCPNCRGHIPSSRPCTKYTSVENLDGKSRRRKRSNSRRRRRSTSRRRKRSKSTRHKRSTRRKRSTSRRRKRSNSRRRKRSNSRRRKISTSKRLRRSTSRRRKRSTSRRRKHLVSILM
jgi:hypothetical protein